LPPPLSQGGDYDHRAIRRHHHRDGQSGKPLAHALGRAGWKTAVIERAHVALSDAIFAHPTLAESLNNLFASLD
jgi:hypothetical protein